MAWPDEVEVYREQTFQETECDVGGRAGEKKRRRETRKGGSSKRSGEGRGQEKAERAKKMLPSFTNGSGPLALGDWLGRVSSVPDPLLRRRVVARPSTPRLRRWAQYRLPALAGLGWHKPSAALRQPSQINNTAALLLSQRQAPVSKPPLALPLLAWRLVAQARPEPARSLPVQPPLSPCRRCLIERDT